MAAGRGTAAGRLRRFNVSDFATIADWASIVGLLVSVAALCITLRVLFRVGRIEQHCVRQGLLPSYVRKLDAQIKNLERGLKFKNTTEAFNALVVSQMVLGDFLAHLRGRRAHQLSEVIDVIEAVRKGKADATFLAQCEEANAHLKASLESLRSFQQELQWRTRDAD
jgi:hypothetical protein